ncbi:unnamed protein product [Closterium sp. NIES-65]|nr:unnamed protein product [Closterium sp. NIES-65]
MVLPNISFSMGQPTIGATGAPAGGGPPSGPPPHGGPTPALPPYPPPSNEGYPSGGGYPPDSGPRSTGLGALGVGGDGGDMRGDTRGEHGEHRQKRSAGEMYGGEPGDSARGGERGERGERGGGPGGERGGGSGEQKRWPGWPGDNVFRFVVPMGKVGSIIGRRGEYVKKICDETKARVKIVEGAPGHDDRVYLLVLGIASGALDGLGHCVEHNGGSSLDESTLSPLSLIAVTSLHLIPPCLTHIALYLPPQVLVSGREEGGTAAPFPLPNVQHSPASPQSPSFFPPIPTTPQVLVSGREDPDSELPPAVVAMMRVHRRIVEGVSEDEIEASQPGEGFRGQVATRLLVPATQAGSLIGRQGQTIKALQDSTGAHIRILSLGMLAEVCVSDRCVLEDEIEASQPGEGFRGQVAIRLLVPATQAGSLIGRQGQTIKALQDSTGAHIRILSLEDVPPCALEDDRVVEVTGEYACVHEAVKGVTLHLRRFLCDHSVLPLFEQCRHINNSVAATILCCRSLSNGYVPPSSHAPILPCTHPPMHPSSHAPILPCTHPPMHPSSHAPILPCTHPPMRPSSHAPILPCTHPPMHPSSHAPILPCTHPPMHPSSHAPILPCTHPPMHPSSHAPILPCTHPPMHPSSHAPILPCTHPPMHPSSHAPILPCTHPPMHPCPSSHAPILPCTHPPMHPSSHAPIVPCTHPPMHPSSHAPIVPCTHPPMHPSSHAPILPCTHRPMHPSSHAPILPCTHPPMHPSSHAPILPCTHRPMHPSSHAPIVPCTHRPMHPSSHAPIVPCTHRPMHPSSHAPIVPCTHRPMHPSSHAPIVPCTHPPMRPSSHAPIVPCTHRPMHPSSHAPIRSFPPPMDPRGAPYSSPSSRGGGWGNPPPGGMHSPPHRSRFDLPPSAAPDPYGSLSSLGSMGGADRYGSAMGGLGAGSGGGLGYSQQISQPPPPQQQQPPPPYQQQPYQQQQQQQQPGTQAGGGYGGAGGMGGAGGAAAGPGGGGMDASGQLRAALSKYGRETPAAAAAAAMTNTVSPVVTQVSATMQIPLSYVDAIIGPNGTNIVFLRRTSGAAVTIQESRGAGGQPEMTVEVRGSATQVQTAQQLIEVRGEELIR